MIFKNILFYECQERPLCISTTPLKCQAQSDFKVLSLENFDFFNLINLKSNRRTVMVLYPTVHSMSSTMHNHMLVRPAEIPAFKEN